MGLRTKQCTCVDVDLRASELKDVADGLFQNHNDGHLDEKVCEAATGVALHEDDTGTTRRRDRNNIQHLASIR